MACMECRVIETVLSLKPWYLESDLQPLESLGGEIDKYMIAFGTLLKFEVWDSDLELMRLV